jgi:hypothetical protein
MTPDMLVGIAIIEVCILQILMVWELLVKPERERRA